MSGCFLFAPAAPYAILCLSIIEKGESMHDRHLKDFPENDLKSELQLRKDDESGHIRSGCSAQDQRERVLSATLRSPGIFRS